MVTARPVQQPMTKDAGEGQAGESCGRTRFVTMDEWRNDQMIDEG